MYLQTVHQPSVDPLTLAEAKLHLKVDTSTDDNLITALITAGRDYVERWTRRTLVYTGYRLGLDGFPDGAIELPRAPAVSANSSTVFSYATPRIQYYDPDGNLQTLTVDVDYELALHQNPPSLVLPPLEAWPSIQEGKANSVIVDFVAGFGAARTDVPNLLRQAVLLLVGHWYANREAVGSVGSEVPLAVDSILRIYSLGDYQ